MNEFGPEIIQEIIQRMKRIADNTQCCQPDIIIKGKKYFMTGGNEDGRYLVRVFAAKIAYYRKRRADRLRRFLQGRRRFMESRKEIIVNDKKFVVFVL